MRWSLAFVLLLAPLGVLAQAVPVPVDAVAAEADTEGYTLSIQVLLLMSALTVLPAIVLSMTSFTRIIIVFAILRQALGTPQTPPNQVLIGLALFLSLFIMGPVLETAYTAGVEPYLAGELGVREAFQAGMRPVREFMLAQTREADLELLAGISGREHVELDDPGGVPLTLLIPSFVTSELKTAFQIGFLVFLPFVVIDLVVASILMSMGMMMLSPMLISLPFKIMLFVLVDGWALVTGTLAASFFT